MNKKTLEEVYSKSINRVLKVFYVLLYLLSVVIAITIGFDGGFDSDWWWGILITWAVLEFIKRSFYYVTAGDIAPEE